MYRHAQVAFIRQQKLGFQSLDSAEFDELRPLLVKVEQGIGNRDFAATLLQGNPADAFFKASICVRMRELSQAFRQICSCPSCLYGMLPHLSIFAALLMVGPCTAWLGGVACAYSHCSLHAAAFV